MDEGSRMDEDRIKDIIYKRRNNYDIVNDPESIASCKREQNRDVIDNSRLGSYDKYGNYVIIPEIKRELISMPKLIYNQYSSNGIKVYELKSTIPIFNDIYLKLVISGDMANLMICEQVNREAGGYLEVYDEIIDSTAMGLEERLPLSIVFRNYNIFDNPNDFGKELKDSKFDNILTRKVYLGLLSKELKNVSTVDEKIAFKNMVSTLKQSGEYGQKVLNEFLGRLKDRPAIFEISKAENYNKAMNEVLLSSLEIATTEQDKQDAESRQTYLEVLNARDHNIEEDLLKAHDRVSEEYVKHIVDKAKSDFINVELNEEELTASDEFYAKISSDKTRVHHRTLEKPILKQGKESAQDLTSGTKEDRIKKILAQKENSAKKTPAGKKLKASKGKTQVKKLKAGAKKKATKKPAKKKAKPKNAKVKSKKKVKKAKPKTKKKTAKKKVKRKLAKKNLKSKKGKVKAKKKKVKKPKNAKKAKAKAGSLKPKKQPGPQKLKASASKGKAKKKNEVNLALQANLYERAMDITSMATLNYKASFKEESVKTPVKEEAKVEKPKEEVKEEEFTFNNLKIKDTSLGKVKSPTTTNTNAQNIEVNKLGASGSPIIDNLRVMASVAQDPQMQIMSEKQGGGAVLQQEQLDKDKTDIFSSVHTNSPIFTAEKTSQQGEPVITKAKVEEVKAPTLEQAPSNGAGPEAVEEILENIIIEKAKPEDKTFTEPVITPTEFIKEEPEIIEEVTEDLNQEDITLNVAREQEEIDLQDTHLDPNLDPKLDLSQDPTPFSDPTQNL